MTEPKPVPPDPLDIVPTDLKDPWLVAAWPGMGAVAHIAASHLAERLDAQPLAEVPAGEFFEVGMVETEKGLFVSPRMPRTVILVWRNPGEGRDLLILLGERQPSTGLWRFCDQVLGIARQLGVVRVFTFAAMATPSQPESDVRVFTAASDAALLDELRQVGALPLSGGEIGGMNGVFLAAAAQRDLPAACLLGEFPYFASSVPNPKASAAILRAFSQLAGLDIDLGDLERQGDEVARQLSTQIKQLEQTAFRLGQVAAGEERTEGEGPEVPEDWPQPPEELDELSPEALERIETLFAEASRDQSRALQLKVELDRLGAFKRFEDRFLDLFKKAD